jgi:hypothetical protein
VNRRTERDTAGVPIPVMISIGFPAVEYKCRVKHRCWIAISQLYALANDGAKITWKVDPRNGKVFAEMANFRLKPIIVVAPMAEDGTCLLSKCPAMDDVKGFGPDTFAQIRSLVAELLST